MTDRYHYRYTGVTADGRKVAGTVRAESASDVVRYMRSQFLTPESCSSLEDLSDMCKDAPAPGEKRKKRASVGDVLIMALFISCVVLFCCLCMYIPTIGGIRYKEVSYGGHRIVIITQGWRDLPRGAVLLPPEPAELDER